MSGSLKSIDVRCLETTGYLREIRKNGINQYNEYGLMDFRTITASKNSDESKTKGPETTIGKGTIQRTVTVVEHNAESMQSGAVYIIVFV